MPKPATSNDTLSHRSSDEESLSDVSVVEDMKVSRVWQGGPIGQELSIIMSRSDTSFSESLPPVTRYPSNNLLEEKSTKNSTPDQAFLPSLTDNNKVVLAERSEQVGTELHFFLMFHVYTNQFQHF